MTILRHLAVLAAAFWISTASAQSPPAHESIDLAPVTLDGHSLFTVRGASSMPARDRAAGIRTRIVEAARDEKFDPADIQVVEATEMSQIRAGQRVFLHVFNADAELEAVDRHALALVHAERIKAAIADWRAYRQPDRVRAGIRTSAIAIGALAVFLVVFLWITKRLVNFLEVRLKARDGIKVQSLQLIPGVQLWNTLAGLLHVLRVIVVLIAIYICLQTVLSEFPQTRSIGLRLGSYLMEPLRTMGRGFVEELPSLIFLLVLFFVVRFILKLLAMYFTAIGNGTIVLRNFEAAWATPTYRLIRFGVIAFGLVVAYPYIPGSDSDAFKGLSIFAGVLFSIGSSSFIANNVAGYALIYRRVFEVGDRVRIGDTVGEVLEMRLQVTRLRTFKNEEVIVPNSTILGSEVMNYSSLAKARGLILHTTVGIGYETPWRQVEGMLLMAADRTTSLLKDPPPFVLQKKLGDFCVTYELNVYVGDANDMAARYDALHQNILDVFNEYGVQIMTPAYEGDPPEPKIVPRDRWHTEPARRPPGST